MVSHSDHIDFDRVASGTIPWSLEGLAAAIERWSELAVTPHDDWDRRRRGLRIVMEDGEVRGLMLNPDLLDNQIMGWVMDRFKDEGLDGTTKASHAWRLMETHAFLKEQHERLRSEGLIIPHPDDPRAEGVADALIEVLATAAYEGVRLSGPGREPVRSFHPDRIISEARTRLDAEEGSGGAA